MCPAFDVNYTSDNFNASLHSDKPVPVAARSKASVCDRTLTGTVGSNPAEGMDVCLCLVLCIVR
jgi:hypothetical protein